MNIPDYVHERAVIIEGPSAGKFEPQWNFFITQLLTQLQMYLSDDGYVTPNQPTDNINTIAASDLEAFTTYGAQHTRLLMDSTTNEFKAIINGVVKTVTLT
jgi:hypothetical protein